jgi:enoyl-CoA hydratase
MKTYNTILIEKLENIVLIRLNRPKAYNALNFEMIREIPDALADIDQDDEIGAVVITGNDKAFCAGADIKDMVDLSTNDMVSIDPISPIHNVMRFSKPIVGAVSGFCLGGGNELSMSLDIVIASETAVFGQPEINLGVIPGAGGTQRLTRALGKVLAMEVMLNDRRLSAQEALHHGLINYIFPVELYLKEAIKIAKQMANRASIALAENKKAVNAAFETSLKEGLALEREMFNQIFDTEDQVEGMQAFAERRKANWQGK